MKRLALTLLALSLSAGALPARGWDVKTYYPTSVAPQLPDAAEARAAVHSSAPLLGTLRDAHRAAAERGWVGPALVRPANHGGADPARGGHGR